MGTAVISMSQSQNKQFYKISTQASIKLKTQALLRVSDVRKCIRRIERKKAG